MKSVTRAEQESNFRRHAMGETMKTNVLAEVESEENNSSIVHVANDATSDQVEERDQSIIQETEGQLGTPSPGAPVKMDSTTKKTATMRTQKTYKIADAGAVRDSFESHRKHLQTESQVTLDANTTSRLN